MSTLSPNMSLSVPSVGVDTGPNFAYQINTSLNILDAHNHSPGNGVQITPSGLNINTNLTLNSNSLTSVGSFVFTNGATNSTLDALYVTGGELWFNDATNPVQITLNGQINATSSGISSGAATAAFAGGVLQVYSNASNSTPGNIQGGSLLLGNNTAGSLFVTLQPPTSTGTYSLTLPTVPGATSLISLASSGVMGAATMGTTMTLSGGGTLNVASGGITDTQVSNTASIQASKLSNAATGSGTGGSYSNGTSTFTTIVSSSVTASTGRPFAAVLSGAQVTLGVTNAEFRLQDITAGTTLYTWSLQTSNAGPWPVGSFSSVAVSLGSGNTIAFQGRIIAGNGITIAAGAKLNLIAW